MDFRLVNAKTLPQAMDLWDECFEKRGRLFTSGTIVTMRYNKTKSLGDLRTIS